MKKKSWIHFLSFFSTLEFPSFEFVFKRQRLLKGVMLASRRSFLHVFARFPACLWMTYSVLYRGIYFLREKSTSLSKRVLVLPLWTFHNWCCIQKCSHWRFIFHSLLNPSAFFKFWNCYENRFVRLTIFRTNLTENRRLLINLLPLDSPNFWTHEFNVNLVSSLPWFLWKY